MSEMKIYAAMLAVADGLRQQGIAKSATCQGGGNFKYRGIDSVYAALSPLLVQNNVIVYPEHIERLEDVQAGKMRLVRINVSYRAVCTEDGSSISFAAIGEGCDTSDKAAGKAMSYAYKTAMFQVFCIPVEGQEDPDQVVHQVDQPFVSQNILNRASALEAEMVNCFTIEELNRIASEINALGLPNGHEALTHLRDVYKNQKRTIAEQVNNI